MAIKNSPKKTSETTLAIPIMLAAILINPNKNAIKGITK